MELGYFGRTSTSASGRPRRKYAGTLVGSCIVSRDNVTDILRRGGFENFSNFIASLLISYMHRLLFLHFMRFLCIASALAISASGELQHVSHPHLSPLSLVELGLEDKPFDMETLREAAKKKFTALMEEAEVKARHDPAVMKAQAEMHNSELKLEADSHKATDLLKSIKLRMAESKKNLEEQETNAPIEAAKIHQFIDEENKKLETTEKKLMQLQQKKITASFAEMPVQVSAASLLEKTADNAKAQQEIHAAEKALSQLGSKIKKRIESLTNMLQTPGKQFPGEIVL